MSVVFGFAAELHKKWLYSPAWRDEEGQVWCTNPAGFGGKWKLKSGGVFFPEQGGGCFCPEAMEEAKNYCESQEEKQ